MSNDEVDEPSSGIGRMICLALAITISLCIIRFLGQVRIQIQRIGLQRTLRALWRTPWRQFPSHWFWPQEGEAGVDQQGVRGARGTASETHEQKVERISRRVQKLPTEEFMDRAELEALPLQQLKAKLKELGLNMKRGEVLDRSEAISIALEKGGSSSTACGICCEDYVRGDSLRKLPACGHRFHLECVDRWLLSSCDYSRRKASCPMCNTEI